MEGQTQAVSAVLMTGIILGAVSAVYIWGAPLLEKRESQVKAQQVESDVTKLKREIESLSSAGEGITLEQQIRLEAGDITVNESQNYIEVVTSHESDYPSGSWTLIEGDSFQGLSVTESKYGIKAEEKPSVVIAKSDSSSKTTYRLDFRIIKDPTSNRAELIDLSSEGPNMVSGQNVILAIKQETKVDEIALEANVGGDKHKIDLERHNVRIDLQ